MFVCLFVRWVQVFLDDAIVFGNTQAAFAGKTPRGRAKDITERDEKFCIFELAFYLELSF